MVEDFKITDNNFIGYKAPTIPITTTVSSEFHRLAKKYNISWAESLRIGLSIIFAEMGEMEYDNKLNLYRKMNYYKQLAEESAKKAEELTKKLLERDGIKFEGKDEKGDISSSS